MVSVLVLLVGLPIVVVGTTIWCGRRIIRCIAAVFCWFFGAEDYPRLSTLDRGSLRGIEINWNLN